MYKRQILGAIDHIKEELKGRREQLMSLNKLVEEQRISQRTQFDMEMMQELGYCSGIEMCIRDRPRMRAVVPEPGIPRVSRGTKEPVEAALLAASGAARPRRLPSVSYTHLDVYKRQARYGDSRARRIPAPCG